MAGLKPLNRDAAAAAVLPRHVVSQSPVGRALENPGVTGQTHQLPSLLTASLQHLTKLGTEICPDRARTDVLPPAVSEEGDEVVPLARHG
jgi:hypothetical protein